MYDDMYGDVIFLAILIPYIYNIRVHIPRMFLFLGYYNDW